MLVKPKAPKFEINETFDDTDVSIHEIKLKIRHLNQKLNPRHVLLKKFVLTEHVIRDEYNGDVAAYREDNLSPEEKIPFFSVRFIKKSLNTFITLSNFKKDSCIKEIKKVNFAIKSHCISVFSWLIESHEWAKKYSDEPQYKIARQTRDRLEQKLEWEKAAIEREKALIDKSKKELESFRNCFLNYFIDVFESAKRLISTGKKPYIDQYPVRNFINYLRTNKKDELDTWLDNKEIVSRSFFHTVIVNLFDYTNSQDVDIKKWMNVDYLEKTMLQEVCNISGKIHKLINLNLKVLVRISEIEEERENA